MSKETASRKSQLIHRASPAVSATKYSEGTKKKGNDGNTWVVNIATNGVKRWKKVTNSNSKSTAKPILKNPIVVRKPIVVKKPVSKQKLPVTRSSKAFEDAMRKNLSKHTRVIQKNIVFDFVRSVKHIGTFYVNERVLVGDILWDALNLRPGNYHVYLVDESPMIVHESLPKITKQNLSDYHFSDYGYGVGVDTGVFGFFDSQFVESTMPMSTKQKQTRLPTINWNFNQKVLMRKNYFFLQPKLLKDGPFGYPPEEKVGFISATGQGDGIFACFIHKREIALLSGYVISNKLYDRGIIN